MKVCTQCKQNKLLDKFHKQPKGTYGVASKCKECLKFAHRKKPVHKVLLNNAKNRARAKGLEFSLTSEWLLERLEKGLCEVTGINFEGYCSPFAPSLDRKDPNKGYTEDNTQVVVWIYNRCKNTDSHEDVLRMALALSGGIH